MEESVHEDVPLRWAKYPGMLEKITKLADANRADIGAEIANKPSQTDTYVGNSLVPCCSGTFGLCQCNYQP